MLQNFLKNFSAYTFSVLSGFNGTIFAYGQVCKIHIYIIIFDFLLKTPQYLILLSIQVLP